MRPIWYSLLAGVVLFATGCGADQSSENASVGAPAEPTTAGASSRPASTATASPASTRSPAGATPHDAGPSATPPAVPTARMTATATATAPPIATPTAVSTAPPRGETWTVTYIVDGDTVEVQSSSGVTERVRVIGIDTPERGECGFEDAADALARLVDGKVVTLVAGARDDRDIYGRLLRYLDTSAGDAGLALIRAGLAIARYDSRDGYGRHPREDSYVSADASSPGVCE